MSAGESSRWLVVDGPAETLINGWRLDQRRRGLMPATIVRRADMVRSFASWLGCPLGEATAEDVEVFLDLRRTRSGETISARTRYTYLSALSTFYRWAVKAGHVPGNPTEDIARPRLRRTLPRPVTDEQLDQALAALPAQPRMWVTLAAYAGLRCAEIAGLERDDVLEDLGMLRIRGKGGKERLVPMHPVVAEALAGWPKPARNRAIFRRPAGAPWPADLLSRTASAELEAAGVGVTMHQFRHWFATRSLRACRNLRTVQELLGHSSPNTTAVYTAFVNEDGVAAVQALPVVRPAAGGRRLEAVAR